MPSFLNPLERDRGGNMNIEVGSKWVRNSLYDGDNPACQHPTYFLEQIVEVKSLKFAQDCVQYYLTHKSGEEYADIAHVDTCMFLKHFSPLNISLENK